MEFKSAHNFHGFQEVYEISMEARNKTEAKKAASYYILKKIFPRMITILASYYRSKQEGLELLKQNSSERKGASYQIENMKSCFNEDSVNAIYEKQKAVVHKINLPLNVVNYDGKDSEHVLIYTRDNLSLLFENNFSTFSCQLHQAIIRESLSIQVTAGSSGIYEVKICTGDQTNSKNKALLEAIILVQNKKAAKQIGGLLYLQFFFPSIFIKYLQLEISRREGNTNIQSDLDLGICDDISSIDKPTFQNHANISMTRSEQTPFGKNQNRNPPCNQDETDEYLKMAINDSRYEIDPIQKPMTLTSSNVERHQTMQRRQENQRVNLLKQPETQTGTNKAAQENLLLSNTTSDTIPTIDMKHSTVSTMVPDKTFNTRNNFH